MLLELDRVSFAYSRRAPVLNGITVTVSAGERVGLVGPNGSGKSTLIRLLADLLHLRRGHIRLDGRPHGEQSSRQKLAYVASNDNLPQFLTGSEYIDLLHRLYDAEGDPVREEKMFARYGMGHRQHDLIEDYSHGMRKKIQVIATLLLARPLTIIDETLNGVDASSLQAFAEDVARMPTSCALLFCSHDLELIDAVCDRVLVLSHGDLRHDLSMARVRAEHGSLATLLRRTFDPAAGLS